jgi:hypothetical protein
VVATQKEISVPLRNKRRDEQNEMHRRRRQLCDVARDPPRSMLRLVNYGEARQAVSAAPVR